LRRRRRVGELDCGGGEEVTVAEDFDEASRLAATYENLRERLIAGGFIPHLLTASGGIAQIDRGDLRRIDGQVDAIWTR
jgi:hypothetical protein